MSLAQGAMAGQGLDVNPQLPMAGLTPHSVQNLEASFASPLPSLCRRPARRALRWATLSFPSSLVRQAQAPFNLLKCGPWGCAALFVAAGLPAVLA